MVRVLIGILITAAGFVMIWKSEWFLRNFGRVEWAEEHLALQGGSRLFYQLLGTIIILVGLFVISGIWTDIMESFARLFTR